MPRIELKSEDIECGGCAASISRALGAVEGVQNVDVDVEAKSITVDFDAPATADEVTAAVEDAGFALAK